MTTLPFVVSDWRRETAQEPVLKVQNRFFEKNPSNFAEGSSLILRPAFTMYLKISDYPIRSLYQAEGIFDNDLFTLTTAEVLRTSYLSTSMVIASGLGWATQSSNTNRGTFVQSIGDIPGYFYFVSESVPPRVYGERTFATGTLTQNGDIEDGAIVRVGNMYYQFTNGSVDAGTPNGTNGNPWLVKRNPSFNFSFGYLYSAITNLPTYAGAGIPGQDYSTNLVPNPDVSGISIGGLQIKLRSNVANIQANTIATTVGATAVLSWGSTALVNGGVSYNEFSYPVYVPGGKTVIAVTTFNSYVIFATRPNVASPTGSGEFYWIEPGETTIDPLNFATAEVLPDSLASLRVVGDSLVVMGRSGIEFWQATGNVDLPFVLSKGRTVPIGVYPGSDVVINTGFVFVGSDRAVYYCEGTSLTKLSNAGIEEQIRKFLATDGATSDAAPYTMRSWYASVDDHLFYFLTLGEGATWVCDIALKFWYPWKTSNTNYLVQHAGISYSEKPQYPALTGNISSGVLYMLDPEAAYDDTDNDSLKAPIHSITSAGLTLRMRDAVPCDAIYLSGSVNSPAIEAFFLADAVDEPLLVDDPSLEPYLVDFMPLNADLPILPNQVRLEISDDNGKTWWIADEDITVTTDGASPDLTWQSLGTMQSPGRLFRITDYGAMKRLDGLDIFAHGEEA